MRELVFALEFRGQAEVVPGTGGRRRARSTAPSQALRTILSARGVEAAVEVLPGASATLESEVERFGDGTFVERGSIAYGELGTVSFDTVGRGVLGDLSVPGWTHGAVMWTITGGAGGCAGARGLITSSFKVSAGGEVVDHQVARILLPMSKAPA